jgi:hypothetical protein
MPSHDYGDDDETVVGPPPSRGSGIAARFRLHNYDFKLPEGGGGATYEKHDPSRITIRLGNAVDYFRLTVDEGIALRLRHDLAHAIAQLYAARRGGRVTPR